VTAPHGPLPGSLPEAHRRFLETALATLARDARIAGVAAGGSFLTDTMDEFSDLDLVVATEPAHHAAVMAARHEIARSLGPLLAAFTGEHVGEPRLLICLYDVAPPLHVDLKFVSLPDAALRVEDPVVLWERDGRLTRALAHAPAVYPEPDRQWIEDRFWVWVHYAAGKIGRGELFEALDFLSYLRAHVLGPLASMTSGARPSGVRRLESQVPEHAGPLSATIAAYDGSDCLRALKACVELYRALRSAGPAIARGEAAERAAVQYVSDVERELTARTGPGKAR
jgi:hypothetical protein